MLDVLFVYVYDIIGFNKVIEDEDDSDFDMGLDFAIGDDFSGKL